MNKNIFIRRSFSIGGLIRRSIRAAGLSHFFFLAIFACSLTAHAQSAFSLLRTSATPRVKHLEGTPDYQRVKIWLDGRSPMALASLGIDISEGDYRKNVWFVTDCSSQTISKVQHAGFRTEIVIEDVKAFYKNRIQSAARHAQPDYSQSVSCGTFSPRYPTPSHFYYGSMGGFFTYGQLLNILDSMALLYPNLITVRQPVDSIKTIEGRDIFYLRISDNPNVDEPEPEVLYTALHHAREPESISQLIYYMWYLLENYATDPEIHALVDNTEMYFVPCINPDGYIYNESTDPNGGGLWRKNRRDNLDGEFGVDLNRNYGYNFGFDDFGSSPFTADDTYRGALSFSEPETQAIRDFTNAHQFRLAMNYHTFGNHLVTPWGNLPAFYTPDSAQFDFYGHAIAKYDHYHVGTPYQTVGYVTNGSSDDWMYGEQNSKPKIFSMTPEVGEQDDGFWPVPSRIQFLSESNVFANLTTAKLAGHYGMLTHHEERYTGDMNNWFHFNFRELGLDTAGTFTVTLNAITPNIIATGAAASYTMMSVLQSVDDSISFMLDPGINPGDEIKYTVTLDNGLYSDVDTITQLFGNPIIALNDDGSNLANWNTSGTWDATTEDYVSSPSSITDSPFQNYQSNENNNLELTNTISLAGAVDAQLTFSAKWNIEAGYDYMQVSASSDGGSSWSPLCGKYTVAGSSAQLQGEPLYDGVRNEWVEERMSLNDYLGQNILLRFQMVSDNFSEFDGFYFDDLQVSYINATGVGLNHLDAAGLFLSHPSPNPSAGAATVNYANAAANSSIVVYNVFGQLIWKKRLEGTSGKIVIPTNEFSSGMYSYFIQLPDGSASKAMKLVKN
jgi:carboxypeptidase T